MNAYLSWTPLSDMTWPFFALLICFMKWPDLDELMSWLKGTSSLPPRGNSLSIDLNSNRDLWAKIREFWALSSWKIKSPVSLQLMSDA
jgi:hypothetical protein